MLNLNASLCAPLITQHYIWPMKFKFTLLNILLLFSVFAFSQVKQSAPSSKKKPLVKKQTSPSSKLNSNSRAYSKKPATPGSTAKKYNSPGAKASGSNDITGIWRGYFAQNNFGFYEDRYRFEVQVEQGLNDAINGVTYSYKTTVFYGKATLQGVYTKSTKNIVFNELKLVELKIGDDSQPCLMTCYLEYDKMGNLETLTGTYTSRNLRNKGDCGSGKVYLEKKPTSDFYKEDFLVKRENQNKKQNSSALKPATKKASPPVAAARPRTTPAPQNTLRKSTITTTPKIKPGAEGNLVTKKVEAPKKEVTGPVVAPPTKEDVAKIKPVEKKVLPKPEVLRKRTNELVRTFYTSARQIRIELYDNGEIDGDTITVYHNNRLVVSRKRLTDKPITLTVHADEDDAVHEFVMVAENLGSIPPNTALMIITAGSKRYETFVTSTEQKNAVVVLEYKPEGTP